MIYAIYATCLAMLVLPEIIKTAQWMRGGDQ